MIDAPDIHSSIASSADAANICDMSHKHARLLKEIYREPVSANIHWRDIESLLRHLGAETITSHGAGLHLKLNGVEGVLHRPKHSGTCTKQHIRHLRKFLAATGTTLSQYEQNH